MGATMSPNGTVRKSLAGQIDRLDSLLDGLAENLQDVITAAVREAVTVAVAEAVTAVIRETAVLRHGADQPARPPEAEDRTAKQPSVWARLFLVLAACRDAVARVADKVSGTLVDAASHFADLARATIGHSIGAAVGLAGSVVAIGARAVPFVRNSRWLGRHLLLAGLIGLAAGLIGPLAAGAVGGLGSVAGSVRCEFNKKSARTADRGCWPDE